MHYEYQTQGTCARRISLDLEGGIVHNVRFQGGCDGNLKAIPVLVEGLRAEEVERKLRGITCGMKPTSCGDQLARAVRWALEQEKGA